MTRLAPPHRWIPGLLVLLAALLAQGPALDGSFVYDDHYYVLGNPAVSGEASPWTTPLGTAWQGLWRPLTVASMAAQWTNPPDPAAFHAVDLGLHALVSLLVLGLALRLGLSTAGATLAGLLFALHPVHAEAVAWVSGRAEVLAAAFVLTGWIAHRGRGTGSALLAGACVLLAGLSKENALVAPGLFLLGDLVIGREDGPPTLGGHARRLLPSALAVLALIGLRVNLLEHAFPDHGPFLETDFAGRVVVALAVLGRSLRLLAWPHPLRVEYQKDEVELAEPLDLLAVAALVLVFVWSRRRLPVLAMGLAMIPLALFPVLHLVPIGEPFAERFLYLPSVPFCLALGAGLGAWIDAEATRRAGRGTALVLSAALVVAGLAGSRRAAARFRDDLTLWAHTARAAPHVALARYNHGSFLREAGRWHAESRDRPGALDELTASLELSPRHVWSGWAHLALASAALDTRPPTPPRPGTAASHLRQALDCDAWLVEARLLLADLALAYPEVVGRSEALDALAEVTAMDTASAAHKADAARMRAQLVAAAQPAGAEPPGASTGTSSDEGS